MCYPFEQLFVEETKDNYSIDLSFAIPECTHLPKDIIDSWHKAVNPHAQRLVAAATKSTQPLPKANGKPKPATKGKAKSAAKAKVKSQKEEGKDKEKEEKEVSEYSQARNKFMSKPESLVFKV